MAAKKKEYTKPEFTTTSSGEVTMYYFGCCPKWWQFLLIGIELVVWVVPYTIGITFTIKYFSQFHDWRMYLSLPIMLVLVVVYTTLNIATIKAILKIGDKKKKK